MVDESNYRLQSKDEVVPFSGTSEKKIEKNLINKVVFINLRCLT